MKRKYIIIGFISGLVLGGLIFSVYQAFSFEKKHSYKNLPIVPVVSPEVVSLQNAFVQIANMVKPAVVQITTEKVVTYRYWDPFGDFEDFFNRSPFEDFFNFPKKKKQQKTYKERQEGLGSGFIVDEKWYILTNNHVIEGVDKILVKLFNDDHKYEAKLVGTDPKTDLALIKIDAKKQLPTVALGDSDAIQVGEWVIAIGNPMGLEETVTVGVVSAKGRKFGGSITQYEDFIQTDAAINRGNSGGPLLNIKGEVIGINTFILNPYIAQNIGFAIPINLAKSIFGQLKEKGKVVRGYLGVFLQPLDEELANSFGLKEAKGALVAEVIPDTPAEKAGIKEGDVIIEYNGKKIEDIKELQMEVASTPPGQEVNVVIWRNKTRVPLKIKIKEMPEEPVEKASYKGEKEKVWRGLEVSSITDELREEFNIDKKEKGVVVVEVEPDSPAGEAGISPGTIIKKINDTEISDLSTYKEAIKKISKNEDVRLYIKQNMQSRWVLLKGEK